MNKKGISPVIAEVLLIAIGVSAAVSAGVFLQGTLDDVQDNAENQLTQEEREDRSEIQIDYGYNGSQGYLLLDVSNTRSRTLKVEEDDNKNWNLYTEGTPSNWEYTDPSKKTQSEVLLSTGSTLTINTTEKFPSSGNSIESEITGPYGLSTSYICFSTNGECDS